MEITFREVIVSFAIIIVSLIVGFIVATKIHDYITTRNDVYFKAVKIEKDPQLFNYAISTELGDVLSRGEFKADKPVSDPLIKGEYSAILRVEERYTQHTRQVSYKCGKRTCWRTETYWTWDEVDRERFLTPTLSYLGQTIKSGSLKELQDNYGGGKTVDTGFHERMIFYTIPTEFNGALFASTKGKRLSGHELYYGHTVKSVVEKREKEADKSTVLFWVLWILFVIVSVFGFYYLENEWLNNWGKSK